MIGLLAPSDAVNLTEAHKGYEYQDLMAAIRLVDSLLGTVARVDVDRKLHSDDVFDDLTVETGLLQRDRTQFKHTSTPRAADIQLFSTNTHNLRLDRVVRSILNDRDTVSGGKETVYRVFLCAGAPPENSDLDEFLSAPIQQGRLPFWPGFATNLKQLVPGKVLASSKLKRVVGMLETDGVSREDIKWALDHLVIEFDAPEASLDLLQPGAAELALLRRVREELGAGSYPNESRSAIDVARAIINSARQARQGSAAVSPGELARTLQLQRDFGALARAHPVNSELLVKRSLQALITEVEEAAAGEGLVLMTGPPGQGKSWLVYQLHERLEADGWLVAEHYCYLSEVDKDREARVIVQRAFGTLMARVAEASPVAASSVRPRFAATPETLVSALEAARKERPERRIVLVVDGIDHVDRIRNGASSSALQFVEELAALRFPGGVVLIVLSQPGPHLKPLEDHGCRRFTAPSLSHSELRRLVENIGLISTNAYTPDVAAFLSELAERSAGNALYATYLCRQLVSEKVPERELATELRKVPAFDGTLHDYYNYLVSALDDAMQAIVEYLALIEFSVTRDEFGELAPWLGGNRLEKVLLHLSPVLTELGTQGGVRIYHESFARFLKQTILGDPARVSDALTRLSNWLECKGFLQDARAFRFLLPTLNRLGLHEKVCLRITTDFASECIAAGWMPSAIYQNLAEGVEAGAAMGDWPFVVRCVELARAAWTFEEERLEEDYAQYVDVAVEQLGPDRFVEGLLYEGRCTVPPRVGLKLCELADIRGATAPWGEYLDAMSRFESTSNVNYGRDRDEQVEVARVRGLLRTGRGPAQFERLLEWIVSTQPSDGPRLVLDTLGEDVARRVAERAANGDFALELCDVLRQRDVIAPDLLNTSLRLGLSPGRVHHAFLLGANLAQLATSRDLDGAFLETTVKVLTSEGARDPNLVLGWLDMCLLVASIDPTLVMGARAILSGDNWYTSWLRFVLHLVELEVGSRHLDARDVLDALTSLTVQTSPFRGEPRAVDLYLLTDIIQGTLRRALSLVTDEQWAGALQALKKLSQKTTTSLRGSPGGPLTTERLLLLVVEFTTPARYSASSALVEEILADASGHTYLAELAAYRLCGARLAQKGADPVKARELWSDACRLLIGYGFRKDTTLWELLDPLDALGKANRDQTTRRLEALEVLCWRVLNRTDGRETRHAIRVWLAEVAALDPGGAIRYVVERWLGEQNERNTLCDEALSEVWRLHQSKADVVVAATFRYASALTVDKADVECMRALLQAVDAQPSEQGTARTLARVYLARFDECPHQRRMSNGNEFRVKDNQTIDAVNQQTVGRRLPRAEPVPLSMNEDESWRGRAPERSTLGALGRLVSPSFGLGTTGVEEASREWEGIATSSSASESHLDRLANAIGYRLVEIVDAGGHDKAHELVVSLGRRLRFGGGVILEQIGDGLSRHRHESLAATAYALAWTRTRGDGGWSSFGGSSGLSALRNGFALDRQASETVLKDEVRDIVAAGDYRTYGITRALVQALEELGDTPSAFRAWDEAHAVISTRLPELSGEPGLDHRYTPKPLPQGEELNLAFAMATIVTVCDPSWERKRRALVSTKVLLDYRPDLVGQVVRHIVPRLQDPSTLAWLLSVVVMHDSSSVAMRECEDALRALSKSELLTPRALARLGLTANGLEVDPPPVQVPDPELLSSQPCAMILGPSGAARSPSPLQREVFRATRSRLANLGELGSRLFEATVRRVDEVTSEDGFGKRNSQRYRSLAGSGGVLLAEGSLPLDEAIEGELQRAAAGARAAASAQGNLNSSATDFEDRLAQGLFKDPRMILALEERRCNRLPVPPPPSFGSVHNGATDEHVPELTEWTTRSESPEACPILNEGEFPGWRILGYTETDRELVGQYTSGKKRHVWSRIDAAIELKRGRDDQSPHGSGGVDIWLARIPRTEHIPLDEAGKLVLQDDSTAHPSGSAGPGWFCPVLSPSPRVVADLALKVSARFEMRDPAGLAIVVRTWRSDYSDGEYSLPTAARVGTALLIRADLFDALRREYELSWREFVSMTVADAPAP